MIDQSTTSEGRVNLIDYYKRRVWNFVEELHSGKIIKLDFLNSEQAAELLTVSTSQLSLWRQTGDGPFWLYLGERLIRYERSLLLVWLASRGVYDSTS